MQNEFYMVGLETGEDYYYKDRDHAHDALWQIYLNNCAGYETEDQIQEAFEQLNEFSMIDGIGLVYTLGFED